MTSRRGFLVGSMCLGSAVAARADAGGPVAEMPPVAGKDLGKAKTLPPGRYDEHVHVYEDGAAAPAALAARIAEAGLAGACVYSREQTPEPRLSNSTALTPEQIVDNVIEWCSASPTLYPFYWIDPSRHDAVDLVDMAVEKGICGFKVIRNNGYPCDGPALDAYRRMARYGKPVTFHSGILYDGVPSSEYFRPAAFESLLRAPGLRFCLAHVSWPWCDECLAVFGKMNAAARNLKPNRPRATTRAPAANPVLPEMFVDSTPGAHGIWRREAFQRLYGSHFRPLISKRLMFGTDCSAHDYGVSYARQTMAFDDALFRELEVSEAEIEAYYGKNLQGFLFG